MQASISALHQAVVRIYWSLLEPDLEPELRKERLLSIRICMTTSFY